MIDEKKLIEELESLPLIHGRYDHEHANSDFISGIEAWHETVLKKINEQPKCFEWIPCSDRLPDDRKDKIVYLSSHRITIAKYNERRLSHSGEHIGWGYKPKTGYIDFENETVVAWMELPEPYKAGD